MDPATQTECRPRARSARVAICVVTYRRPEGLLRLLSGLEGLRFPDAARAPDVRVVVVDNDPEGSARRTCRRAAAWMPFPLSYVHEKCRGIPQARNAALAAVRADVDFVAFLDDDEVCTEDWLAELLEAGEIHDADAVTGPCLPRFDEVPRTWVIEGDFFDRPRHEDGARLSVAFTHNVLIRTSALADMDRLFDERMALTGGSDAEFFRRFARSGHSIVWADAAVVHEIVPLSRANLRWILERSLRVGTSWSFIDRSHAPGSATALHVALHGGWCVAKGGALSVVGLFRGGVPTAKALRLAAFGVGRLAGLFGFQVQEYRAVHGR